MYNYNKFITINILRTTKLLYRLICRLDTHLTGLFCKKYLKQNNFLFKEKKQDILRSLLQENSKILIKFQKKSLTVHFDIFGGQDNFIFKIVLLDLFGEIVFHLTVFSGQNGRFDLLVRFQNHRFPQRLYPCLPLLLVLWIFEDEGPNPLQHRTGRRIHPLETDHFLPEGKIEKNSLPYYCRDVQGLVIRKWRVSILAKRIANAMFSKTVRTSHLAQKVLSILWSSSSCFLKLQ